MALRLRGVDVLTAVEDNTRTLQDPKLLDRASELGRFLYTMDEDLLVESMRRLRAGTRFSGVIYSHQLRSPTGRCIDDIEIIAKNLDPKDLFNIVEFIPY